MTTDNAKLIAELSEQIRQFKLGHAQVESTRDLLERCRVALSSPVASAQDCPNCAYPLDGPHKGERRRKWEQATPVASAQVPRDETGCQLCPHGVKMFLRCDECDPLAALGNSLAERNANG